MTSVDPASFELLVLFDVVTILSFALIALILATAYCSKHVHLRKAWYGQMVQWMIYCMSYMLLFGFQEGTEPPRSLCLFQASLIYACPPACAVGSTCFIIDFYMSTSLLHKNPTLKMPKLEILFISLPWITLTGTALQVVLFTVANQKFDAVRRSPGCFLCNISDPEPTIVSVTLVLLALIVWFYYEVQSGIIMYRNRLEYAGFSYKAARKYLSLYIRSAILTVGMAVGTAISIWALSSSSRRFGMGTWSVALPFMPIFVALVFGTQEDIMRVWMFWKKRTPEEDSGFKAQSSLTFVEMLLPNSTLVV
ncbi:hypothetical protein D9756_003486 [Leucocoprinus leucothites]|uniref:G protein-coupled receptor n=1 Tax=Leucocoprinus leucothites TaxID=201217 RepID=A0A8H5G646_9AGAR|nr:hypothetical protein D9756_003486 [Leucoagaricus leucothites]